MADMDAEVAMLMSMQAMTGATGNYDAMGAMEADLAKSLSTEDNHHLPHVQDFAPPADAVDLGHASSYSSSSAFSASPSLHLGTTDLDPSTALGVVETLRAGDGFVILDQPLAPPASANIRGTSTTAARPQTMGGFVVDDDDDDDDDETGTPTVATSNGVLGQAASPKLSNGKAGTPQRVASKSPAILEESSSGPPSGAHHSHGESEAPRLNSPDLGTTVASPALQAGAIKVNGHAQVLQAHDLVPASTVAAHASPPATQAPAVSSKARLPHDRVGILEDRIKEDPRGDLDAWLALINEHRKRNRIQDARSVYERFFRVFPMAAEQWAAYISMELANNELYLVEETFNNALRRIPHLQLWSMYLDYVRRRNNLTTDTAGTARTVISQAYDFVLQNVGIDKDAGRLWQEYIHFLRSGPGTIGGSSWQDQQKMDQLRRAYQRAICIPTAAVNGLWREYDAFEMGLNKITGRKFLQDKSPAYMTARSSNTELDNITQGLQRTTLPRFPPAVGFDGEAEYMRQVELWNKWIRWEKDDPLVLKDEDVAAYRARVVYVFKQAVMALRFWPEIWFEAAEFCFQHGLEKDGNEFLAHGIAANPESCLLAFKRGDRLEMTLPTEESEQGLKRRGAAVREPYDALLNALYALISQAKTREAQDLARIEQAAAKLRDDALDGKLAHRDDDDDDDNEDEDDAERESTKKAQLHAVQEGSAAQVRTLSRTISFAWIGLMRAMRRVQGKGSLNGPIGGSRQIFTDARKRGRLTSDVYVASALIEHHCYKDPAATKIFERGMKLFPEDEGFALEYLKHLLSMNDITNARAVFEMTVSRLGQKPETLAKAKPVYAFFHQYEAHYGELGQIKKLEQRMAALFPDDPTLSQFGRRFARPGFDPTAVRLIISPGTQTRARVIPSIEGPSTAQDSPINRPLELANANANANANSPKRRLGTDDLDYDSSRPRKMARGDSPVRGAAGRRMDHQKRPQQQPPHQPPHPGQHSNQHPHQHSNPHPHPPPGSYNHALPPPPPPPPSLPREILFLLSIIPRAHTYYPATHFRPESMVRLLRDVQLPSQPSGMMRAPIAGLPQPQPQHYGAYPYAR
ncbi:MAG: mRNA 3'-end-processing protein rna14 [Phylliscum demangeonii]|nr:MAG: mRNA 3'-end-processing protein rna14 [Phylliscum demangeonii]